MKILDMEMFFLLFNYKKKGMKGGASSSIDSSINAISIVHENRQFNGNFKIHVILMSCRNLKEWKQVLLICIGYKVTTVWYHL